MSIFTVEPLLNIPIAQLELSDEFKLVAEVLGFEKLSDLLPFRMPELLRLPGFDHRLWNEYVAFLEAHRIGHYLN